jgi:hypothetical protein
MLEGTKTRERNMIYSTRMQIGVPSKRPLYRICRGSYLCCVVNAGKLMRARCRMSVIRNPNYLNIISSAYNKIKTGDWRHTKIGKENGSGSERCR